MDTKDKQDVFSPMTTAFPPPETKPSKSPQRIAGMFDSIAQTYDLLNDCMTGGMHRQWKKRACQLLEVSAGDQVLDVCTGTGDLAHILSQTVGPMGQVTGIDFSSEMLSIAQKRFTNHVNIHWQQGNAMALPFENNTFDGAVISFGLRNVESVEQTLSEMARVVRPGGWVVNLDTASNCNNPLFWLYFKYITPLMGKLLARNQQAYQYLCQSTRSFESPKAIADLMIQCGLENAEIHTTGFGATSLQRARKP